MFFLLIWLPFGMLVVGLLMFIHRDQFTVYDVDDFLDNALLIFVCGMIWPVALIAIGLVFLYELIYER